jgi:hypothetical protein
MADAPYLVALALLERGGQRALPLTGKSQRPETTAAADPGADGQSLALELLLRLWQQSGESPIRRIAENDSLLLVEIPLEAMQERLPQLKAAWLSSGDSAAFLVGLRQLAGRAWRIEQARYEGIRFVLWP